jgi:hypothetical protein
MRRIRGENERIAVARLMVENGISDAPLPGTTGRNDADAPSRDSRSASTRDRAGIECPVGPSRSAGEIRQARDGTGPPRPDSGERGRRYGTSTRRPSRWEPSIHRNPPIEQSRCHHDHQPDDAAAEIRPTGEGSSDETEGRATGAQRDERLRFGAWSGPGVRRARAPIEGPRGDVPRGTCAPAAGPRVRRARSRRPGGRGGQGRSPSARPGDRRVPQTEPGTSRGATRKQTGRTASDAAR